MTTETQATESAPAQVQLPGGILLKPLPFKITEYEGDSPKRFELLPRNAVVADGGAEHACVLFAREDLMRSEWPGGRPPREPGRYRGPKSPPTKLQLRGGVVLKGLPFKIVGYDRGVPKLLELQRLGAPHDLQQPHTCVLFAGDELIRRIRQP